MPVGAGPSLNELDRPPGDRDVGQQPGSMLARRLGECRAHRIRREESRMSQGEPYLRVVWTDPETGRHGYVVIDRLVRGISGGGTRLRRGATPEEAERPA